MSFVTLSKELSVCGWFGETSKVVVSVRSGGGFMGILPSNFVIRRELLVIAVESCGWMWLSEEMYL